ncbi:MAG: zinc-ribbon domain-containing protein [wastewater metagenome]|nr:zinc-ribbon domain-containing protein [Candidatus Loosdrechtia aerotolerans]
MADYFTCPNCGAEVPLKSLACPECGSDRNTGWSDDTIYDGLDLPEEEDTPNLQTSTSLFQNRYFISIVAIISLIIFLLMYLL